jgi:hypothetical protein
VADGVGVIVAVALGVTKVSRRLGAGTNGRGEFVRLLVRVAVCVRVEELEAVALAVTEGVGLALGVAGAHCWPPAAKIDGKYSVPKGQDDAYIENSQPSRDC